MDTGPILFLDSGIGGISYYSHFASANADERLIYVADRGNFPYGPKTEDTLIRLLTFLIGTLIDRFQPKLIVLACNTASVTALDALRSAYPAIPFVGTVPAVKPAAQESVSRHIGVLGTERTVADPYILQLAKEYGPDCTVTGIAAPELVEFVEHRYADADAGERLQAVIPYLEQFRERGADAIVLGCTHFLWLSGEFKSAAGTACGIYDSVEGVSRRVASLLDEKRLRSGAGNGSEKHKNMLLVTGSEPLNEKWFQLAAFCNAHVRLFDPSGSAGESCSGISQ